MPQVNAFVLLAAFPCFNVYELGIIIDLQQAQAWRALAAYIMVRGSWGLAVVAALTASFRGSMRVGLL